MQALGTEYFGKGSQVGQSPFGVVDHLHLWVISDIEIAVAQIPKPITQLAKEIGIKDSELEQYGKYKAKVELSVLERLRERKDGKYIVISGYVGTLTKEIVRLTSSLGLHQRHLEKENRQLRSASPKLLGHICIGQPLRVLGNLVKVPRLV